MINFLYEEYRNSYKRQDEDINVIIGHYKRHIYLAFAGVIAILIYMNTDYVSEVTLLYIAIFALFVMAISLEMALARTKYSYFYRLPIEVGENEDAETFKKRMMQEMAEAFNENRTTINRLLKRLNVTRSIGWLVVLASLIVEFSLAISLYL